MNPEKPGVDEKFTVAAQGSEEQKRQQAIEAIHDQEQRQQLQELRNERNKKLQGAREFAERQERAAIRKEMDKRERAKAQLDLKPEGSRPPTREQLEKQVTSDVRRTMGAQLDAQLDHYGRQLNQQLDREIDRARTLERDRSPRQSWKQNADQGTTPEPKRPDRLWKKGPLAEPEQAKPEQSQRQTLTQSWTKAQDTPKPEQGRGRER